jgi:hypothetical protein
MTTSCEGLEGLVREALNEPRSWQAVVDAYLIVEADVKGHAEIQRLHLASRGQLARFMFSVEMQAGRALMGAAAFRIEVPRRLMTLAEAYAFVSRLCMAWIAHKQRTEAKLA